MLNLTELRFNLVKLSLITTDPVVYHEKYPKFTLKNPKNLPLSFALRMEVWDTALLDRGVVFSKFLMTEGFQDNPLYLSLA